MRWGRAGTDNSRTAFEVLPADDVVEVLLQQQASLLGKRKRRSAGSRGSLSPGSGFKYDPTTSEQGSICLYCLAGGMWLRTDPAS